MARRAAVTTLRRWIPAAALGAACFAAGWLARGQDGPVAAYGRLRALDAACRDRGQGVRGVPDLVSAASLTEPPREGRQTLHFARTGRTGELIVAETPLDDELEARATRYQVAWSDSGGWFVRDCAVSERRRF
jgi:hypothetical protein